MNLRLFFLFLIAIFVYGCSSQTSKSNSNAAVNTAPAEAERQPKSITIKASSSAGGGPYTLTGDLMYASWHPSASEVGDSEITLQSYCISTSSDVKQSGKTPFYVTAGKDSFEICFEVNQNKRFDPNVPVDPGSYYVSRDMSGAGKLREFHFRMMLGEQEASDLLNPDRTYGPLKIESATADRITGSIAMSDEDYSINGEFDAKVTKY